MVQLQDITLLHKKHSYYESSLIRTSHPKYWNILFIKFLWTILMLFTSISRSSTLDSSTEFLLDSSTIFKPLFCFCFVLRITFSVSPIEISSVAGIYFHVLRWHLIEESNSTMLANEQIPENLMRVITKWVEQRFNRF